jgi:hypothetical protein
MDPKTARGSDAQVTPKLMGISPGAEDLAESAWLNESANLDEIDLEELANGTTVLELVDLPPDEASTAGQQDSAGSEEEAQAEAQAETDTAAAVDSPLPQQAAEQALPVEADTATPVDPPLPQQAADETLPPEPSENNSARTSGLAQPTSASPASELTPEGMLSNLNRVTRGSVCFHATVVSNK